MKAHAWIGASNSRSPRSFSSAYRPSRCQVREAIGPVERVVRSKCQTAKCPKRSGWGFFDPFSARSCRPKDQVNDWEPDRPVARFDSSAWTDMQNTVSTIEHKAAACRTVFITAPL